MAASIAVGEILKLHGLEAYVLVGTLCFFEIALFIGFVLPGEIAVIYGGVLASQHNVNIVVMAVLVVACAIGGNFAGYGVGRLFGPYLLSHRPLKDKAAVERARVLIHDSGAWAVFIGRFVAVVRALVAPMSGVADLAFRPFALASTASGLIWGLGYTMAGYAAGLSYAKLISAAGKASAVAFGVVVVFILVTVEWRRRRRHYRSPAAQESKT